MLSVIYEQQIFEGDTSLNFAINNRPTYRPTGLFISIDFFGYNEKNFRFQYLFNVLLYLTQCCDDDVVPLFCQPPARVMSRIVCLCCRGCICSKKRFILEEFLNNLYTVYMHVVFQTISNYMYFDDYHKLQCNFNHACNRVLINQRNLIE